MKSTSTTSATRATTFRLTAENRDTGELRTLASSKSLGRLAGRIIKDAEVWDRRYEGMILEDNAIGTYTPTLLEDLRGRYQRAEISAQTWRSCAAAAERASAARLAPNSRLRRCDQHSAAHARRRPSRLGARRHERRRRFQAALRHLQLWTTRCSAPASAGARPFPAHAPQATPTG